MGALACSLGEGVSWFLNGSRVGVDPAWAGGVCLGGLPTLLVVLGALMMHRTLLLFLTPQKWQLGFGSFCILLFLVCTTAQLFLVPYSLFVFSC